MKPISRLDKITLSIAGAAFAIMTVLGWYARATIDGEEGRAIALIIFSTGSTIMIAIAIIRDLFKPRIKKAK